MKKTTPISSFSRNKIVLGSAVNIGAKKVTQYSKRAFMSKEKYQKEVSKTNSAIAELLFDNISLLKGTAVKITQALSLHGMLPEEITQELSKSYNQIKPISQALVIKVIKNEFQKSHDELFKEFSLKPFASASLGQVHLAKTDKDKKVAVKIQYPSIDKTVKNDIKFVKKIVRLSANYLSIIEEVEEKLYEEIDYEKELRNTQWAYVNLNSELIVVPKVYKKYSTKHILTTEYIEGMDLHSWLKTNPTMEQKQKIANSIFDVFVKSVFEHKKIQADPNPANYMVTSDNKLALIDFGCMKSFDDAFIKNYIDIMQTYILNDPDDVTTVYQEMGLINHKNDMTDKLFKEVISPFNQWAVEPYLSDEYRFTKEYLKQGVEYGEALTKKPFTVVKDYVFLDRTIHGLFSLFEQMDVVVDMRGMRKALGLK